MDSDPPSPASSISSKENIPLFTQHEDVPRAAKKRRLQKKGDPKATEEVGARLRALRGLTNGTTVGGEEISEAERGIFEGLLGKLHEEDSGFGGTQVWARPDPPTLDPEKDSIIFQQIDIDEYTEPNRGPTLRMFGVSQDGHSVLAHVRDFLPYFWIAAPRGFKDADCVPFCDYLNRTINNPGKTVAEVTVANKKSLWGYKGDDVSPFIKIAVTDYKLVSRTKDKPSSQLSTSRAKSES